MKRRKTINNKTTWIGAAGGLIISFILLTLVSITYNLTVKATLLDENLTFIFKFFSVLYSWPFMILALLFSTIKVISRKTPKGN